MLFPIPRGRWVSYQEKNKIVNTNANVNYDLPLCPPDCSECDDIDSFASQIDEKTKAIYVESMGNPRFNIPDFDGLSDLAKENGMTLGCFAKGESITFFSGVRRISE